tara:strand:+ start:242 stop:730 length:489 start_codon:yes stop_codon:yes gene_type:complete
VDLFKIILNALSLRLKEIIGQYEDKWDELVKQLLLLREEMDVGPPPLLPLTEIESPFYNILLAEITKISGDGVIDEETHDRVIDLIKKLVEQFEKDTLIVGFFEKENEMKQMRRTIKRSIIENDFDDPALIKIIVERFMDLGKVKFHEKKSNYLPGNLGPGT